MTIRTNNRRWRIALALLALGSVAVACGSDDEDEATTPTEAAPEVSQPDDTATSDTETPETQPDDQDADDAETGTEAPTGGETDLGDFPIPAPPGGTVEFDQVETSRVVSYPVAELDNIVAFYEDWIAAGDWSPPEGVESNVFIIEQTGQISGTAFASENQIYMIVGTPDGDRIDLALSVQG